MSWRAAVRFDSVADAMPEAGPAAACAGAGGGTAVPVDSWHSWAKVVTASATNSRCWSMSTL
eukprot:3931783-Rhodomonas_salina.1